jgi:hypothetical protein
MIQQTQQERSITPHVESAAAEGIDCTHATATGATNMCCCCSAAAGGVGADDVRAAQ